MDKLSDEEIVKIVRVGDSDAYREIVLRYQEKLIRYLTFLVGDEYLAADAAQEAFLKAYINLQGFDVKRKFSSWIYRIAHNEAMNLVKKKKREVSLEDNSWIEEIFKSKSNVEAEFEQKEIRRLVKTSLKKLPLKYRSPLALFYLEEYSYEEIGDILRKPLGTVGTLISRGKKLLKKIVEKKRGKEHGLK
ncbi:MAG: sigma-70 family RNA polymerase sigma factor [Candidatus Shapirobacteria bacterium]